MQTGWFLQVLRRVHLRSEQAIIPVSEGTRGDLLRVYGLLPEGTGQRAGQGVGGIQKVCTADRGEGA